MEKIRIVLCRPMHPGNIGSAARAMKTMGLSDLRLVEPQKYPAPEARWMATHAVNVLEAARVHASLAEAVADCQCAFALSARMREWSTPVLDARAAAAEAGRLEGPVAFVFGNEEAGLTNDEMLACQYLVHIPADPEYSSLNLAQAVQVVAYELFLLSHERSFEHRKEKPATVADREGLYGHLEQAAIESEFFKPETGSKLPTRLRRLFSRVPDLEREEVNILRGLLNALQKARSK
jgi:TrmH family RNA methyltransferase